MALTIKDGLGVSKTLATGLSGSDLVPFHGISGSVSVVGTTLTASIANTSISITASQANPVYVTGNVNTFSNVYNAPNSALYVTSSTTSPVWVSSSIDRPVFVTGTVDFGVDTYEFGTSKVLLTRITSSFSNSERVWVTGNVDIGNFVGNINVTSSMLPVTGNVQIKASSTDTFFVTSSNTNPVITRGKFGVTPARTTFTPYSLINYTNASSGSFIMASASVERVGLVIFNASPINLYISIGDSSYPSTNGFNINSVSSEPVSYSFILYPSGTYFVDPVYVNLKYSGFFISSSNVLDQAVARVEIIT